MGSEMCIRDRWREPNNRISSAFSPCSNLLVSISGSHCSRSDGRIKLWDLDVDVDDTMDDRCLWNIEVAEPHDHVVFSSTGDAFATFAGPAATEHPAVVLRNTADGSISRT